MNYKTGMIPKKKLGLTPEHLVKALLFSLFQIKPLIFEMNNNKEMEFEEYYQKVYFLVNKKLETLNNFQGLLNEIIENIEISLGINTKEYYDQAIQFDEKKAKEKFMKVYQNAKLIQKFIQIPKEEIISCQICETSFFNYKFNKFYYLNEKLNSKCLSEKIFSPSKESEKTKCNFCNGKETICLIEKKIINYPNVLIVVIDNNQINSFSLQNNIINQLFIH